MYMILLVRDSLCAFYKDKIYFPVDWRERRFLPIIGPFRVLNKARFVITFFVILQTSYFLVAHKWGKGGMVTKKFDSLAHQIMNNNTEEE